MSSGAGGTPLVDSVEMGLVCANIPLMNHPGLVVLDHSRVDYLKLPRFLVEAMAELPTTEPTPRVSRYDRK